MLPSPIPDPDRTTGLKGENQDRATRNSAGLWFYIRASRRVSPPPFLLTPRRSLFCFSLNTDGAPKRESTASTGIYDMLARGNRVVNVLSVAQQSTTSTTARGGISAPTSTHLTVQTSTHIPSVNTSPFFPEPSTINPQPNPEPWSQDLAKTVLTILIVILIVIMVFYLAFKRYLHLKHTNQPFNQFFPWPRRRLHPTTNAPNSSDPPLTPVQAQTQTSIQSPSNSRTRSRSRPAEYTAYPLPFAPPLSSRHMTILMDDDVRYPITAASLALPHHSFPAYTHPYPHSHSYPPHITTRMLQNRNNGTRTHAANTDAHGRRLDSGWDPDQFDFEVAGRQAPGGEDHEDKEMLPAYDCYGGPPKYMDVEMERDEVEGARGTTNDGNNTTNNDGSGNGHGERPTSSSAVVGHQDVVDHVQENGG